MIYSWIQNKKLKQSEAEHEIEEGNNDEKRVKIFVGEDNPFYQNWWPSILKTIKSDIRLKVIGSLAIVVIQLQIDNSFWKFFIFHLRSLERRFLYWRFSQSSSAIVPVIVIE